MTKPHRYWDHDEQRWVCPNLDDYALTHLDGDPTNNDLSNLRAVPIRENRSTKTSEAGQ